MLRVLAIVHWRTGLWSLVVLRAHDALGCGWCRCQALVPTPMQRGNQSWSRGCPLPPPDSQANESHDQRHACKDSTQNKKSRSPLARETNKGGSVSCAWYGAVAWLHSAPNRDKHIPCRRWHQTLPMEERTQKGIQRLNEIAVSASPRTQQQPPNQMHTHHTKRRR